MVSAVCTVAYGYCECGCGNLAPLDTLTNARLGKIKGVTHCRFIYGHQNAARVGHTCEVASFDLTDEQVRSALDRYFAESTMSSLCRGLVYGAAL